jgi:hypothetical protein
MESWRPGEGKRVFDILVQGATAFADVDIFAEVGLQKPLLKTATVTLQTEREIVRCSPPQFVNSARCVCDHSYVLHPRVALVRVKHFLPTTVVCNTHRVLSHSL